MGFSNQEKINLNSKVLAAGVKDANEVGQWYESFFANSFVLKPNKVWSNPDLQTLLDNPAPNISSAQSFALSNPEIVEDYSLDVNAIHLTEVPGSNGSTYVAFSIYDDLGSTHLDNWIQPQFIPRDDGIFVGYPSIGYAIRLFNGDPNGSGTEILTSDGQTGSGSSASVAWVFDYANGMLLISSDYRATITDPYILGFRYIGSTLENQTVTSTSIDQQQETIEVLSLGQTAFTLSSEPLNDGYVQMFVNGSKQQYGVSYTCTNTAVTYSGITILDVTDVVEFWYITIGTTEDIGQAQVTIPVLLEGQTLFELPSVPFDDGYVQMYINGAKQQHGVDYTGISINITYTGDFTLEIDDVVEFWYLTGPSDNNNKTLSEVLAVGNSTNGYDINLNSGSVIRSSDGTVTIIDDGYVSGDFIIGGKLTVGGLIDPTGLVLTEQSTVPHINATTEGLLWVKDDGYLMYTDQNNITYTVGGNLPSIITDHGSLSGLESDDHSQYLLVSGSRALSGDLNLDSNDIINVGSINDVVIEDHALGHEAGEIDEIDGYNIALLYSPFGYDPPSNDIIGEHLAAIDNVLSNVLRGSGTTHIGGIAPPIYNEITSLSNSANVNLDNTFVTNGYYTYTANILVKRASTGDYLEKRVTGSFRVVTSTLTLQATAIELTGGWVTTGLTLVVSATGSALRINLTNATGETISGRLHINYMMQDLL